MPAGVTSNPETDVYTTTVCVAHSPLCTLGMGHLANRVQDIAHVYRCAVIMPEGGSIWELYHGCYLGYKPNQDISSVSLQLGRKR